MDTSQDRSTSQVARTRAGSAIAPDTASPLLDLMRGEQWALRQVRRRGAMVFVAQMTLVATVAAVLVSSTALAVLDGFTGREIWIRTLLFSVAIPVIVAPPVLLLSARLVAHLDTATRLLQESAVIDPLTGVANRRGFFAALDSLAGAGDLEVAMIDVDDFKSINDQHGHPAGDTALCLVAAWLEQLVGPDGTVGRLGGDEFAYVAPADPDRPVAPRHDFRLDDASFTASIGRAVVSDQGVHAALAEADADLYRQKRSRPASTRTIVRRDDRNDQRGDEPDE